LDVVGADHGHNDDGEVVPIADNSLQVLIIDQDDAEALSAASSRSTTDLNKYVKELTPP
jgi:hypothetical protein